MFNAIGNMVKIFYIAIYIRLSKEDDNDGESESIGNQKTLLTKYVESLGEQYVLVDIYIDDGYTGTNFERPAFQRMLKDIENGKVNMVITKDLSRLSRDYIGTGEFVEKWFPAHNVRYVALTDNIDTFVDSSNNDIAPFKAILNDMYAKDLSKKIRTALTTMQKEGKWVGGCAPFGYMVDPNDKNHLVPNEIEAPIVKRIFSLFLEGKNINQITDILNDEKVPTFSYTRGRNFKRKGNSGDIYGYWGSTTIKKMLKNRLYTGDLVQNRRSRVSYKYRKVVTNDPDKWIIVENTHEALISKEDFERIQKRLPAQKQRNDKKEFHLLDGILKCADCGHNLSITTKKRDGKNYTVCNRYRKFKAQYRLCTSHSFTYQKIESGLFDIINKTLKAFSTDSLKNEVLKKYNDEETIEGIKRNISKLENEINILKSNLDKMYIDKLSDKITEEMYLRVSNKLNSDIDLKEKKLNETKKFLKEKLEDEKASSDLGNIIDNYLNSETPTRDLVLRLINHIDIHEDGNVDVYFNFKELNIIYESCVA